MLDVDAMRHNVWRQVECGCPFIRLSPSQVLELLDLAEVGQQWSQEDPQRREA